MNIQITEFTPEPKVKRMAERDRPSYRINTMGPPALTYPELLACALNDAPNSMELAEAIARIAKTPQELRRKIDQVEGLRGIGSGRLARLRAVIELGNRAAAPDTTEVPVIHSPGDVANLILYQMSALEQEELWIALLDVRNKVIDIVHQYRGSVNMTQVRVGELFKAAIRKNASNIIVIHNHPSGDPTPSPDDVALTRAIIQAGKMMDIEALDHLVIGGGRWVSLKERGLGFS